MLKLRGWEGAGAMWGDGGGGMKGGSATDVVDR